MKLSQRSVQAWTRHVHVPIPSASRADSNVTRLALLFARYANHVQTMHIYNDFHCQELYLREGRLKWENCACEVGTKISCNALGDGADGAFDRQMYVTAAPCKPFRRIRRARGLDKLIVASCARDDSSCSSCDAARQETNRIWLFAIPFLGLATSHGKQTANTKLKGSGNASVTHNPISHNNLLSTEDDGDQRRRFGSSCSSRRISSLDV